MTSDADSDHARTHLVVRVRLGVDYDRADVDPLEFMDYVAKRLREATAEAGTELDVLQGGRGR